MIPCGRKGSETAARTIFLGKDTLCARAAKRPPETEAQLEEAMSIRKVCSDADWQAKKVVPGDVSPEEKRLAEGSRKLSRANRTAMRVCRSVLRTHGRNAPRSGI